MTIRRFYFVLFYLLFSVAFATALIAEEKSAEHSEQKKDGVKFSIGANGYYALWRPIWRIQTRSYLIPGSIPAPDAIINEKMALFYGPVIGLRFSSRWSTSLYFSYGKTSTRMQSMFLAGTAPVIAPYWKKASKYDVEWLFSYMISRYAKFFIGPKFQGYDYTNREYLPLTASFPIPVITKISQYAGGLGTGFGFTIPLVWDIFLLPNIGIVGLAGKELGRNTAESSIAAAAGGTGSLGLAYYIAPIGTTISAAGKVQYLYYFKKPYAGYLKNDDLFYGLNVSLVFTF